MVRERFPERRRSVVVEDAPHPPFAPVWSGAHGFGQAVGCVFQYEVDLLAGDAWEPFEELSYSGSAFEVVEEGGDGHASATEDPHAANFLRVAFYGGAGGPVEHGVIPIPL
jgi:hypothetical protein